MRLVLRIAESHAPRLERLTDRDPEEELAFLHARFAELEKEAADSLAAEQEEAASPEPAHAALERAGPTPAIESESRTELRPAAGPSRGPEPPAAGQHSSAGSLSSPAAGPAGAGGPQATPEHRAPPPPRGPDGPIAPATPPGSLLRGFLLGVGACAVIALGAALFVVRRRP